MGIVRVSASVSLDGFSAGPDTSDAAPLGVGGERLHRWLFPDGGDSAVADAALRVADLKMLTPALRGRTLKMFLN